MKNSSAAAISLEEARNQQRGDLVQAGQGAGAHAGVGIVACDLFERGGVLQLFHSGTAYPGIRMLPAWLREGFEQ